MCVYLGVELLGHVLSVWLTLYGAAKLFFKVDVPFFIPTSSVWDFQLFPILVSVFVSILGNFLKFIIQLFCRAFISSIRLCINFQELFCFVNVLFWASCSYRMGATFPFVSVRIWLFFCSFLLPAESVSSQYTFPDHLSVCMSVAHVSFP